jgi:hypothetical protein
MALPEVKVRITADDSGLEKGIGRATKALAGFAAKATAGAVASAGALATGLIWAGKRAIDLADNLAKTSQRVGTTTENLSRLEYAARLSGASLGDLTTAFTYLSRYMQDSSDKFTELGIAVKNSDGTFRDTNDVFMDVAEVLSQMPDGARKTALAYDLMGRSATVLIPLMNAGRAGLKGMGDEADNLGQTISTKFGKSSEAFNDNLSRIKSALEGIINIVTADVIVYLEEFSNKVVEWVKDKGRVRAAAKEIVEAIKDIAAAARAAAGFVSTLGEFYNRLKYGGDKWQQMQREAWNEQERLFRANERAAQYLLDTQDKVAKKAQELAARGLPQLPAQEQAAPVAAGPTSEQLDRLTALKEEWTQEQALLAERVAFLNESMMSEEEMLRNQYAKDLALLDEYYRGKQGLDGQYRDTKYKLDEQLQKDLAQLEQMRVQQALGSSATMFGGLAQLAQVGGKKLFNIAKAFSIAEAVMNTAQAVTKSLTSLPFPFNLAAAAGTAAAGAAQIATIAATQPGGGGGGIKAPSASGGAGAAAAPAADAPAAGGGRPTQVALQLTGGDLFGRDQVISLINAINEAQEDGAVVRLV